MQILQIFSFYILDILLERRILHDLSRPTSL